MGIGRRKRRGVSGGRLAKGGREGGMRIEGELGEGRGEVGGVG